MRRKRGKSITAEKERGRGQEAGGRSRMQQQEVGAGGRSRRWVFDGFGGFAAFRAESLWLSVCALKITSGYAAGGEASVCGVDWSESRRHSARRAAKPPLTDRKPPATCCHLRRLLLPPATCRCLLPLPSAPCPFILQLSSPTPSFGGRHQIRRRKSVPTGRSRACLL